MAILPTSRITDTMDDRSPVPAGEYIATIVKSEIKATKSGNGHYLAFRFKIAEGDQAGKMIFNNLNYDNPNPVAVEIAFKALNSIKAACGLGVDEGDDTEELHGIPMKIKVTVRQGNAQYPPNNEINGYSAVDDNGQRVSHSAPTKKPWEVDEKDEDIPF